MSSQTERIKEQLLKESDADAQRRAQLEEIERKRQQDLAEKKIVEGRRRAAQRKERAQSAMSDYETQAIITKELNDMSEKREGTSVYAFSNGDTYEGEWSNGKMQGKGKYTSSRNLVEYDGEWFEGLRHGKGTFKNDGTGSVYTGMWKQGKRSGDAVLTERSGKYVGTFVENAMEGKGAYTFTDGAKYEGEFHDDEFAGKGVFTTAEGDRIEGTWVNGAQEGHGKIISSNGHKYEGEFKHDKKEGRGTYTAPDFQYTGEWHDDMMHGFGKYTYDSQDCYEGNWVHDKEHGAGVYTFAVGGKYDGNWQHGARNGHGTFTGPKGDAYVGEWKDDQKEGTGKYTFLSGAYYDGEWANDNMHGKGVYMYASGKKYHVVYVNGKLESKSEIAEGATSAPSEAKESENAPITTTAPVSMFPEWMSTLSVDDDVKRCFLKEKIDEASFALLEESDLKELGIPIGPRKLLMKEIAKRN